MNKKYTGNFTADATKAARNAERLCCQVSSDGTIFVTDGHFCFKMKPFEYAALVQPISRCDAGNWAIDKSGKHESTLDIESIFAKSASGVEAAAPLASCPLCFTLPKATRAASLFVGYYNAAADFAAFYNKTFISAIVPGATFKASSPISAAIAYCFDDPIAVVMPIKPDAKIVQSVKAYFSDDTDDTDDTDEAGSTGNTDEADALRDQLHACTDELSQARDEIASMREQIAQNTSKPESKTAAELIAARFAALPGVQAIIKGAQTAAPVVWITGEIAHNADEIKAAGAKWSIKKSAYYVRVA